MASVFLSPSTQEFNPYIIGGNEEYYMNLLADKIEPYLTRSGIEVGRNNPNDSVGTSVAKSNSGNYDLHVALHSNAAPDELSGRLRGPDIYYYSTSNRGRRAAEIIAGNLDRIYPFPNLVDIRPTSSLYEVRRTRAPAAFIELAYHDNTEDAMWIAENLDSIAQNIARSITEFLGVPFSG